ncbi:MAG: hypothetical protein PHE89_07440 [Alphaproteobacteria bacterium]|nr:hypothetical protein [Alphaproteobacteria bacterium]
MGKNILNEKTKMLITKILITLLLINSFLIIMRSSGVNDKLSFVYFSRFIVPIIALAGWSFIIYIFNFTVRKELMIKTMLLLSCLSTTIFIAVHYFVLKNYCIPSKISSSCDFIRNNKAIIENLVSYYSISLISSMCLVSLFIIGLEDNIPKRKIGIKSTLTIMFLATFSIIGYFVVKDVTLLYIAIILFLPFLTIKDKKIHFALSANMLFISITILLALVPILFSISQGKTFLN